LKKQNRINIPEQRMEEYRKMIDGFNISSGAKEYFKRMFDENKLNSHMRNRLEHMYRQELSGNNIEADLMLILLQYASANIESKKLRRFMIILWMTIAGLSTTAVAIYFDYKNNRLPEIEAELKLLDLKLVEQLKRNAELLELDTELLRFQLLGLEGEEIDMHEHKQEFGRESGGYQLQHAPSSESIGANTQAGIQQRFDYFANLAHQRAWTQGERWHTY